MTVSTGALRTSIRSEEVKKNAVQAGGFRRRRTNSAIIVAEGHAKLAAIRARKMTNLPIPLVATVATAMNPKRCDMDARDHARRCRFSMFKTCPDPSLM